MAESEESLQLKRRARRRLVGAIALVTFVVIILPVLLDKEPGPAGPPLDVQIPKPESGGITSRIGPPAAQPPIAPAPATASEKQVEAPASKSEPVNTGAAAAKAESPAVKNEPAAAKSETGPAAVEKAAAIPAVAGGKAEQVQATAHGGEWVVALDAFSDAKNVTQLRTKLSAAGVKSYTEAVQTSKGGLTRVRAGPFDSKEAAEKARAKLVAMGLKPGAVVSR